MNSRKFTDVRRCLTCAVTAVSGFCTLFLPLLRSSPHRRVDGAPCSRARRQAQIPDATPARRPYRGGDTMPRVPREQAARLTRRRRSWRRARRQLIFAVEPLRKRVETAACCGSTSFVTPARAFRGRGARATASSFKRRNAVPGDSNRWRCGYADASVLGERVGRRCDHRWTRLQDTGGADL
jgi:hypothetical protein